MIILKLPSLTIIDLWRKDLRRFPMDVEESSVPHPDSKQPSLWPLPQLPDRAANGGAPSIEGKTPKSAANASPARCVDGQASLGPTSSTCKLANQEKTFFYFPNKCAAKILQNMARWFFFCCPVGRLGSIPEIALPTTNLRFWRLSFLFLSNHLKSSKVWNHLKASETTKVSFMFFKMFIPVWPRVICAGIFTWLLCSNLTLRFFASAFSTSSFSSVLERFPFEEKMRWAELQTAFVSKYVLQVFLLGIVK